MALVMDASGNLLVYKNKGRPTSEEKRAIEINGDLNQELRKLKKQMSYKVGTEILLALSAASDEMMRVVHMFPEVIYMDVISGTNKQKRDLFLMVVKDGNGKTFVGNITVIPSQQRWVFMKIYQTFFVYLYGIVTVSRFQLAVMDDDVSAHGPFDCLIKTQSWYTNCVHMLCVFHGLIMMFHTDVYPLLPHKRQSKLLTKNRHLYGKSL
jgi:hypothetical protein